MCCRSIRVQIRIDTILVRDVPEGQQRLPGYFTTPIYDVDGTQDMDLQQVAAHLSKQHDDFNRHGSGFALDRNLYSAVSPPTRLQLHWHTQWLAKKQAVVNIKNTSDAKCFVWSVLAALHPSAINTNRLYNYRPHENTVNTSGITFPMPTKDIPKFEKRNPSISVMDMSRHEGLWGHAWRA